ncbi:chaperonin CPN60-2, mitochondrial-like protein [Tanacetum coccineum]|uniref:Chaperonin CPN60-2, mitochondrial-like protein n=1 Tax=Tanacetum coccineum TaxID=301880 RepID=A0ABQ5BAP0_9ASTR
MSQRTILVTQAAHVLDLMMKFTTSPIRSMVDVPIHQEDPVVQRTPLIDNVISMVTKKTTSTPTPPTTQAQVTNGRNLVIEQSYGAPRVTKHGVTIPKAVEFNDKVKNVGATPMQQVANATNDMAGDGTTCATVLTCAIFSEGCKSDALRNTADLSSENTELKLLLCSNEQHHHYVIHIGITGGDAGREAHVMTIEGGGETTSSGQTGSWVLQIPLMEMELAETVLVDRW